MPKEHEHMDMKGLGWRVSLSILVSLGWLVFLVIWLFFYAGEFSLYQNIAVFLASVLVVVAIMGASWAPWGMKHGDKDWTQYCQECGKNTEHAPKPAARKRPAPKKR